ncbi:MAG: RNHCP domain-containing protein [Deltaproteobacteria bacterium]|nr:RNHCP domain-containing protein [Candidatus Zymogenaceae bacterium]
MEEKRFQRRTEDFTCGRCGMEVHGTGFTNHCPYCLWSRHVDRNPGDRRESCCGMMRPVALEERRGEYVVVHRCEVCGIIRKNRTAPEDSFEAMIEVMKEFSEGGGK